MLSYLTSNLMRTPDEFNCYFPFISKNYSYMSRLAWCYGDLGIALAFWHAGTIYKNHDWITLSNQILTYNTTRLNCDKTRIVDACICHGASGVALIYYIMYFRTHDITYKNCAEYWFRITLKQSRFTDGLAGYKYFSNDSYINSFGLLTGIAGIGLSLHSYISNNPSLIWEELFLI